MDGTASNVVLDTSTRISALHRLRGSIVLSGSSSDTIMVGFPIHPSAQWLGLYLRLDQWLPNPSSIMNTILFSRATKQKNTDHDGIVSHASSSCRRVLPVSPVPAVSAASWSRFEHTTAICTIGAAFPLSECRRWTIITSVYPWSRSLRSAMPPFQHLLFPILLECIPRQDPSAGWEANLAAFCCGTFDMANTCALGWHGKDADA